MTVSQPEGVYKLYSNFPELSQKCGGFFYV